MRLKEVQIRNFRSIKHEDIVFDPQCRVLVGINESGKSNLLDALSFLSDEYDPQPEDEREKLPDETGEYEDPKVRFIFDITDDYETLCSWVSVQVLGGVGVKIAKKGNRAFTIKQYCALFKEVIYRINIIEKKKTPSYWSMETTGYKLEEGWKKPSIACPDGYKFTDSDGESHELKKLTLLKPKDEWNIPATHLEDAIFDDFHSAVTKKLLELIEGNLPEVVYWKYAEVEQLLPEKINLINFIANQNVCIPLRNMFHLAGEQEIKEVLEREKEKGDLPLGNLLKRVANKSTEFFQSVWKEYKSIKFSLRINGDFIQCSVTEKNDRAFQRRSDGFKKFVAFLLNVSADTQTKRLSNALILIDEPEAGLHPKGAQYLRDELIKISKSNYVVYSTHSIFMIDRNNIDRHLIVKKKDEITKTEQASEGNIVNEEVLFNALNYSQFQNLKPINIILEGWRDKKLLKVATKTVERTFFSETGIAHAKGVKSYKWFIPILELAERKAIIISDNDKPAKEEQKKYKELKHSTEWKRYDEISPSINAKTGEDFLKKDYLVVKLKTTTKLHGTEISLSESDIPDNNRLDYIKQKLRENGFTEGDKIKGILDDFKTALFEGLTKSKVEDRYNDFLKDLKLYIENNLIVTN